MIHQFSRRRAAHGESVFLLRGFFMFAGLLLMIIGAGAALARDSAS